MRRLPVLFLLTLTVVLSIASGAHAEDPEIFPFDPVALAADKEVPGDEQWFVIRGQYIYRFASEQNRDEFNRAPESFEVQLGGACARMGSLSGPGSVDLFARHDGRLYVFASDSCRRAFLAAPEKLLLTDDPPLMPTPQQSAAGQKMRQQFLDAVGSEEVRNSLTALQAETSRTVKSGGQDYVNRIRLTMEVAGKSRRDEWWNQSNYAQILSGDSAWFSDNDETRPMVAIQQRDANNGFAMHYASLFTQLMNEDVVCEALEPVSVDGQIRNQFVIFSHGIRKTIQLDPDTGRALQITARGHGPSMTVIPVTVEFTEFTEIDGLTLPAVSRRLTNGEAAESGPSKWIYIVNGTIPDSVFALPKE